MRNVICLRHSFRLLILAVWMAVGGFAATAAQAQDVDAEVAEEPGVDLGSEQGLQDWIAGFRGRALAQGCLLYTSRCV